MKNLEITQQNALNAFKKADEKGKELLTELFGKETFNLKITDRIKTLEDALELVGASKGVRTFLTYSGDDKDMKSHVAHAKLTIIAKALNEGWEPNWDNSSEYKYFPYFIRSGSGWAYYGCDCWRTHSYVGSQLVYRNSELAKYAGTQFIDIYREFLG